MTSHLTQVISTELKGKSYSFDKMIPAPVKNECDALIAQSRLDQCLTKALESNDVHVLLYLVSSLDPEKILQKNLVSQPGTLCIPSS